MNKRRSLLFTISGLFATLCGQANAVKSFSTKKKILFLSYEGQRYRIPARKKIVFIDLPPNKYFKIEAIDMDTASVQSKSSYSFRVPCIPTKPQHFALNETNTVFVIYPKGIPWLNRQPKTT
tara:strand:- start:272 stop:637 length:366 start_codon:yes stop_codon:yes gene_type:complete